ncbi:GTPase IMAP family member 8-like [Thunnus maccoyii]|uniref:GTPase IMAP family member 8-like n=1 Tax=Thunnus maccoyii TaxID=8240 RepID=UPI001C4BC67B|nr:GTPase IMAP family member 8-like [Thunnus maccoyii]XP_042249925.1 GTPase IMAP family member 8-like [Thunnus maccoyii]
MASSDLAAWDGWCTSQLKIVLLGGRNSGKSSVGNLILGKEEFVTKERTSCSRRLGAVAGRWLTVVDTPSWWCDFSSQDTSQLVKREIVSSVSLCSPGPHVFLITVKASSAFSEKRRRAVEEHVALLGERVWSHCVVVFTSADRSKHTQAEEHVESGGKALHWLSEKCNQRCHSVILSDETEVTELLVKIQKLVTENGNRVFEMQESILQVNAEEKRGVEERAQQRFMKVKKHRSVMRERLRPITNIRIVLVGAKGSGKTSALNTILGRESSQRLRRTAQCLVGEGVVFGRQVTVVDTPGWWMNYFCDESPIFDRREILLSLSLCPPGPHVFLLVIRVDRAFTETYRRAVQEHVELISEHTWSRVIVLFSFGDWLGGTTTEQYIESEGEPLRWLVERCSNRYHVLNNKTKGDGFQVRELIGKIEEMVVGGDGGWHYELERNVLEQLEGKMRRDKERAEERLMKKEKQRQIARSQLEKVDPLSELRIVLVGGRKTGKSSCGNTILSRECFDTESQTTSCTEKQAEISGKVVTVLDTPGCFPVTSDLLMAPSPCAIVLVVNVSSSFKDANREALEKQLEAGGGPVWSRAMVLFSYGDWLGDTSIEQRIEGEGEPLQRLVERCGNRYHVLDNKHRGDGAQVNQLIELIEEMLVEERLAVLHRGDHMGRSVYSAREQQADTVTPCKKVLKMLMTGTHQMSHELTESAASTSCLPLNCSEVAEEDGQTVALPAGRTGRAGLSTLRWTITGQQMLTVNLPVWFPTDDPHSHLQLNGESRVHLFSPKHSAVVLVLPQTQHRMLTEENIVNMHSLCHPALRENTLRRLTESGGLQALINQWGNSSLEELETFIDSYFEALWEQSMGSLQPAEPDCPAEQEPVVREAREELLSSIDRKLSKLDLLEDIRRDLAELRQSLEHSWRAIQEIREKSKQDVDNTC